MTPLQTAFALGLPLATFGFAGAGVVTAGRRERKLVGERLASVRPGTITLGARTRRAAAAGRRPFAAPMLDPLFGIDRHVASDEAMSLLAPLVAVALAAAATLVVIFQSRLQRRARICVNSRSQPCSAVIKPDFSSLQIVEPEFSIGVEGAGDARPIGDRRPPMARGRA